jgi:hypothetical protein
MVVKMVVRPIAKLSEELAQVQAGHRHGCTNTVDDCLVAGIRAAGELDHYVTGLSDREHGRPTLGLTAKSGTIREPFSYLRAGPPMNAEGLVAAFVLPQTCRCTDRGGWAECPTQCGSAKAGWVGRSFPRVVLPAGSLRTTPLAAMEYSRSIVRRPRRRNRVHVGLLDDLQRRLAPLQRTTPAAAVPRDQASGVR